MPIYEYRCEKCGEEWQSVMPYIDAPEYVAPKHCRKPATKLMSLTAKRGAYIERISMAYGDKPVHVTGADHDKQLRRERGLMTQEEMDAQPIAPNVDAAKYREWKEVKRRIYAEARRKGVSPKSLGLPPRSDYLKPIEVSKSFRQKIRREARHWMNAGAHNVERRIREIDARSAPYIKEAVHPTTGARKRSPEALFK